MNLVAVGLSHRTAPVELREKLAPGEGRVPELLRLLREQGRGSEAVLLATCNRVELYAVPGPGQSADDLAAWLIEQQGLRPRAALTHMYRHSAQDALRHVFRVACSLDSMLIGEPQILGQVRDAYRLANEQRAAGPLMRRVMDQAIHVARRVHNETAISKEPTSVGRAGVELARQVLGELTGLSALLIGAGDHGQLVARSLLDYGLSELIVTNRTFEKAATLAAELSGAAVHMEEIPRYLERVDLVLTSTAAGQLLVHQRELAPIARKRRYRPLVLIDLSVPRNIDPAVNEIEGVYRFDVDDLAAIAEQGRQKRQAASEDAELIVAAEASRCWGELRTAAAGERIGALVRHAEELRQAELGRSRAALEGLDPRQREAVEALTRALVKKLMHPTIGRARSLAAAGDERGLDELLDGWLHRSPKEGHDL